MLLTKAVTGEELACRAAAQVELKSSHSSMRSTGTTGAVSAFPYMQVPPRRSVKGVKKPASHRDLFLTICDGIDQLAKRKAKQRHVSPERVRAELRTLQRKCSGHLTGYLAKTANPKLVKGRGLRVKKKQKIHPR